MVIIAGPHAKRCAKHYTRRIMSAALMGVYRRSAAGNFGANTRRIAARFQGRGSRHPYAAYNAERCRLDIDRVVEYGPVGQVDEVRLALDRAPGAGDEYRLKPARTCGRADP
jgi:hypothetical protein